MKITVAFDISLPTPIMAGLCKLGGKETLVIIEHQHITSKQISTLSQCLLFADILVTTVTIEIKRINGLCTLPCLKYL
jgi:hypothetical protein